ncbi:MAG: hypothetical protein M3P06_10030 [Acidobacteriota bacterium]|nr:hypothetical protein [Acidobacteriota bacterium]
MAVTQHENDVDLEDDIEPQAGQRIAEQSQKSTAWIRVAVVAGVLLIGVARWQIEESEERARQSETAQRAVPIVTWEGKTFRTGDTVRVFKRAGTFKPSETGFPHEIDAAPFRTGVVLGGEKRKDSLHLDIDAAEPIQIVRVRWHRQTWKVNLKDQTILLGEFEATIHASHIEVLP